ncbi:hypothetical protein OAP83_02085 [Rickettsiales bacterium]|nr:hypothetical protein [Rickettsiales bacterium]
MQKSYMDHEMLLDPAVLRVMSGKGSKKSKDDIEAGELVRLNTHHSEQFIMAALKKPLLALKACGVQFDNATIILDIATKFAPCNHCVNRINGFLNEIRNEIFPGNNYLVARVSWVQEYSQGSSPSEVSNKYHKKLVQQVKTVIEIDDKDRNYMLFCHVTPQMAKNLKSHKTPSGNSASTTPTVVSSVNKSLKNDLKDEHGNISLELESGKKTHVSPPRKNSASPSEKSLANINEVYAEIIGSNIGTPILPGKSVLDPDLELIPPPIRRVNPKNLDKSLQGESNQKDSQDLEVVSQLEIGKENQKSFTSETGDSQFSQQLYRNIEAFLDSQMKSHPVSVNYTIEDSDPSKGKQVSSQKLSFKDALMQKRVLDTSDNKQQK